MLDFRSFGLSIIARSFHSDSRNDNNYSNRHSKKRVNGIKRKFRNFIALKFRIQEELDGGLEVKKAQLPVADQE